MATAREHSGHSQRVAPSSWSPGCVAWQLSQCLAWALSEGPARRLVVCAVTLAVIILSIVLLSLGLDAAFPGTTVHWGATAQPVLRVCHAVQGQRCLVCTTLGVLGLLGCKRPRACGLLAMASRGQEAWCAHPVGVWCGCHFVQLQVVGTCEHVFGSCPVAMCYTAHAGPLHSLHKGHVQAKPDLCQGSQCYQPV
jgi:hypothetical protein